MITVLKWIPGDKGRISEDRISSSVNLIVTCHQPHCSKQVIRIQPLTISRNKNHKVIAVKIEGKRKVNIKKCKLLRVRIKCG